MSGIVSARPSVCPYSGLHTSRKGWQTGTSIRKWRDNHPPVIGTYLPNQGLLEHCIPRSSGTKSIQQRPETSRIEPGLAATDGIDIGLSDNVGFNNNDR